MKNNKKMRAKNLQDKKTLDIKFLDARKKITKELKVPKLVVGTIKEPNIKESIISLIKFYWWLITALIECCYDNIKSLLKKK
jgi:hypothetical protein